MTSKVLDNIRQRNKLYRRFQRDGSDSSWLVYRQARNYTTASICSAKQTFLVATASNSYKFWKMISYCTGLGRRRHVEPPWPSSSPAICKFTADAVNYFFISAVDKIVSAFSPVGLCTDSVPLVLSIDQTDLFSLQPVSANDIISGQRTYIAHF